MTFSAPLQVTQPNMPPLEEYLPYLEEIWGSKWLTNKGPFHARLEEALCEHLGVKHLALFCNGTIALITALQALKINGEVLTTPYSFVATSHAIKWNSLRPVFVDIEPDTMNMDPARIEEAITSDTSAILPVHCYGRPCDMNNIEQIADNFGLKVIYDAAHAFGTSIRGNTFLDRGDLSIMSFHATKVFNTFEGGAIVCPDAKFKKRIDFLKNFGFADETTIVAAGINGKMNEIQAAFGLLQLQSVDAAIEARGAISNAYRLAFESSPGIELPELPEDFTSNFSYFPILVNQDYPEQRDELYERLKTHNVFCRRYFFPLISDMPMYREMPSANPANLPVAASIASRVLCLPIHTGMDPGIAQQIAEIINTPGMIGSIQAAV